MAKEPIGNQLDQHEKLARVVFVFLVFAIVLFAIVIGMGVVAVFNYVRSGIDALM